MSPLRAEAYLEQVSQPARLVKMAEGDKPIEAPQLPRRTSHERAWAQDSGTNAGELRALILLFVQLRFYRRFDFFVQLAVALQRILRGITALGELRAAVI